MHNFYDFILLWAHNTSIFASEISPFWPHYIIERAKKKLNSQYIDCFICGRVVFHRLVRLYPHFSAYQQSSVTGENMPTVLLCLILLGISSLPISLSKSSSWIQKSHNDNATASVTCTKGSCQLFGGRVANATAWLRYRWYKIVDGDSDGYGFTLCMRICVDDGCG